VSVYHQPRVLWSISRVGGGALVNERVANIVVSPNPLEVNGWWERASFGFLSHTANGATVTSVRIYGSWGLGAGSVVAGFPPPGTAAEAICSIVPAAPLAAGEGLVRPIGLNVATGGTVLPMPLLPRFLLLEYTMAAGGAGTTIFHVWLAAEGPQIDGSE
jgi:hypothetical protein